MQPLATETNGHIFASWKIEQGQLVRTMVQPSEGPILDFNRELQKNPGAIHDLDGVGRWVLSVPENLYWLLVKKFPDLNSHDSQARTKAWVRLMNDRDYADFRLQHRSLRRG